MTLPNQHIVVLSCDSKNSKASTLSNGQPQIKGNINLEFTSENDQKEWFECLLRASLFLTHNPEDEVYKKLVRSIKLKICLSLIGIS